jgi:hypothetical protein
VFEPAWWVGFALLALSHFIGQAKSSTAQVFEIIHII